MVKKTLIQATKKLGKELIKEASPEHKLRMQKNIFAQFCQE